LALASPHADNQTINQREFRLMKRLALLAAAFLVAGTTAAAAADYPNKTITVIVPHAAGGPTDTVARLVSESMTRTLGQQVIVENQAGAGGTIGTARVTRAEADGYTLLVNHVATAATASLYRKLSFDPATALAGVGLISDGPMTVVAKPDLKPDTIGELLDYIRANKDNVTYAHAGLGTASHLCGMLLQNALKVQMTTVPYKGTGPAMTDLLGGQVEVMCDQVTNTVGHIRSGRIKSYAVTTRNRLSVLPDLPTLDESGLKDFEVTIWHGLFAPKGTPRDVVDKLATALQAALKDPKVIERFAQLGTEPVSLERATPVALDQHLQAEIAKWKLIIQTAGVYAD
jgi:tripartite-type tricarboxylate transporter receptor subunit TctC